MVSSNILHRVFCLRMESQQGTGFTIEVDGQQYLITARHMLTSSKSTSEVEILQNKDWIKFPAHSIPVEPESVDIAVLALEQQLSPLLPILLGLKNSFLSQEVFFVGFPFGLLVDGKALNFGFPLPLVKHGVLASISSNRGEPFFVDGINNPGFSGGPVVNVNTGTPTVIGVVSAYRAAQESVYNHNEKTEFSVRANTGLLVAYDLEYAIEAIKKKPIGYRVQTNP